MSTDPLTKKLLWARIELSTYKSRAEHCTTEPLGPLFNEKYIMRKIININIKYSFFEDQVALWYGAQLIA